MPCQTNGRAENTQVTVWGRLLGHDVELAIVAGAADGGRRVVTGLHCVDVDAQVGTQVGAPSGFQQASGEHCRVHDVFGGHAHLGDRFVVGVHAGGCVAEAHVPGTVQDHGVEHLVHRPFEHDERLGLGDRTGGVPLDEGLNQVVGFRHVGHVLLMHQGARNRTEVLLGHDLGEQRARDWAVGPVLQRNDGANVLADHRRVGSHGCMHANFS